MQRLLLTLFLVSFGYFLSAQTSSKGLNVSVFPNPATEFISINDANDVVGKIAVVNLVGKKMASFSFYSNEKYNISDLPKGLYLVQIYDKRNQILSTQRLNKR